MQSVLRDLDTSPAKYQDCPNVKKTRLILVFVSIFLISCVVRGTDKPVPLVLEEYNTLHVGQLAVLHIPPERRYAHAGTEGAWQNVLAFVRRSKHDVTFRAIHADRVLSSSALKQQMESVLVVRRFIVSSTSFPRC